MRLLLQGCTEVLVFGFSLLFFRWGSWTPCLCVSWPTTWDHAVWILESSSHHPIIRSDSSCQIDLKLDIEMILNSFGYMQHLASGLGGPVAWRQKGELTHAQVTSLSFGTSCIAHIQFMMQESVLLRLSELFLRKQGANVLTCVILSYMFRLREYTVILVYIMIYIGLDHEMMMIGYSWLIGLLTDLYQKPSISCNAVTS